MSKMKVLVLAWISCSKSKRYGILRVHLKFSDFTRAKSPGMTREESTPSSSKVRRLATGSNTNGDPFKQAPVTGSNLIPFISPKPKDNKNTEPLADVPKAPARPIPGTLYVPRSQIPTVEDVDPNDGMLKGMLKLIKSPQTLNEHTQKQILLGAIASKNHALLEELMHHKANTSSCTSLLTLVKDLLTHDNKHEVPEL